MTELLYGLAILACPVGMGAMMWLMMRAGKKPTDSATSSETSERELARLRADLDSFRSNQPTATVGTAENGTQ